MMSTREVSATLLSGFEKFREFTVLSDRVLGHILRGSGTSSASKSQIPEALVWYPIVNKDSIGGAAAVAERP